MRAGQRNRLITIQTPSVTRNAVGQEVTTWETFATEWANMVVRTAAERTQPDQTVNTRSYQLTIRYRNDLTTDMRVVVDGQTLEIEATYDPNGRRIDTLILAIEVNP
jgi:SPP1 family predicted phage head-tail adaptor